ncbi:6-phosphogluconolactonase [Rothia sp. P13129]|uniref:6-phosphogluconolactonase n=1 Tax=Rothia sp. P13129 TaxID=3402664 RepID=UPI003AC3FC8F
MLKKPEIISYTTPEELAQNAAQHFFEVIQESLRVRNRADVCLTGGSMGTKLLETLPHYIQFLEDFSWENVHFWWSDERFVPTGHDDRNEKQAYDAFFSQVSVPSDNIHRMGASDVFDSPEEAAKAYVRELAEHSSTDQKTPLFDVLLLGMGPDGHIASLFPERDEVFDTENIAVAIHQSPKPPSTRVSLTLPVICYARRIWFLISGEDKIQAASRLVETRDLPYEKITAQMLRQTPARGARALERTTILITDSAHQK